MRDITQEDISSQKLLLSQLTEAWTRINRPHINRDLKSSLYTRILEIQAGIRSGEEILRKKEAAAKRVSSRRGRKKKTSAADQG